MSEPLPVAVTTRRMPRHRFVRCEKGRAVHISLGRLSPFTMCGWKHTREVSALDVLWHGLCKKCEHSAELLNEERHRP